MESSGGVRRDGWYWGGIGTKKLLRNGVDAQAIIRKIAPMSEDAAFDVTLEVQPPDGTPYEVQGMFDVADDLYREATPGVTVPVKVHPSKPKRVAIDWDAWRVSRPR
jgi:hypothetical protein